MSPHIILFVAVCLASCYQTFGRRCTRGRLDLQFNLEVRPHKTRYHVGELVHVTCQTGTLFPISTEVRRCTSTGQWSITGGECQESCQNPEDPPYTHREGVCCQVNNVLNYTCSQGLELVGQSQIICHRQEVGYQWSTPPPTCEVRQICDDPGEAEWTTREILKNYETIPEFIPGDAIQYTCDEGYFLDFLTYDKIRCTEDGTWDNDLPYCFDAAESTCELSIANGAVVPDRDEYHAGKYVTVLCDEGFSIQGQSELQCLGNDYGWDQFQLPTCTMLTCPRVDWPENGRLIPLALQFTPGSQLRFVCNAGFTMIGPELRTCEETGQWSGISVRCNDGETVCQNPGIPVGASKDGNNYNIGDTVMYSCSSGMYLKGSSERVCLSNSLWSGQEPSCQGNGQTDNAEYVGESLSVSFDRISPKTDSSSLYRRGNINEGAVSRTIQIGQVGGVDLYFLFDVSGSISETDFQHGQKFACALLDKTGVSNSDSGVRVAFITFDLHPTVHVSITHGIDSLQAAKDRIESIQYPTKQSGRSTSITAALKKVRDTLIPTILRQRQIQGVINKPQNVMVIVTDGNYNIHGNPEAVAKDLKQEDDVEIYCIGVGQNINDELLRKLASNKTYEEHFFRLKKHENFDIVTRLMTSADSGYHHCGVSAAHGLNNEAIEKDAKKGAWPWMAKIIRPLPQGWTHLCGGTLVHKNWILTAAHCFDTYDHNINVILGQTQANENLFSIETIQNIFTHPGYNLTVQPKFLHDIALLKLTKEVTFSPTIRPVCLPGNIDFPETQNINWFQPKLGHKGVVTGWGYLDDTNNTPDNMRQKQMDLRTEAACERSVINQSSPDGYNSQTMFCAGNTGVDTCFGDSGGPFMVQRMVNKTTNEHRFFQIGIVSWGFKCRVDGEYGFYTKLNDEHLRWIRRTITENP